MPYFEVQTSTAVEKKKELYHELARVMELVPGKSEKWVMVHLEDQANMSFGGNAEEPAACIVVKTFGELEDEFYTMLTAELCKSVSGMLGVSPERLYVTYEGIQHWGWNGSNF